jgi:hypothetical protein
LISKEHNNGKVWDLRWRFEYSDGHPTKFGMWSKPGERKDLSSQAWAQKQTNISRACIEAKFCETKETRVVASCRGDEFVNFQWMAEFHAPMMFKGEANGRHVLNGLKLLTAEHSIEAYGNGEVVTKERPEAEKKINFVRWR